MVLQDGPSRAAAEIGYARVERPLSLGCADETPQVVPLSFGKGCDLAQEDQLGGGDGTLEGEGRAQLCAPCCTAQLGKYSSIAEEEKTVKTVRCPSRTAVMVVMLTTRDGAPEHACWMMPPGFISGFDETACA